MDGSAFSYRKTRTEKSKPKYRARMKKSSNEHHRTPRCQKGSRGLSDLNILKAGTKIHDCYHALFGTMTPTSVCIKINQQFADELEYLVSVPTKDFSTFHCYFTNRKVIKLVGMAKHGLTWGHLYLYGSQVDLLAVFRGERHYFTKPNPAIDVVDRWQYLFPNLSMSEMAYQLTKYWLPLECVIVAIPKVHQVEVNHFLEDITSLKKHR